MKWRKITIDTTTEAVDFISGLLDDLGIEGMEVEDHVPLTEEETKGMFIDILPDPGPDDGKAKVSFYLDMEENEKERMAQVEKGLEELRSIVDVGSGQMTLSETEDQDWINNWKAFFKPFTVGDILIKPTWEEIPENMEGSLVIEIDPGTAFGTGSHETTQLCIRQLEKYLKKGDRVLDIGTGSGILSIAALKLGASFAFGTDVDENAVETAGENGRVNGIGREQFTPFVGNIIEDETLRNKAGFGRYDIVVANILAPVIIELAGEAGQHVKPGGYFITSGIINTREEDVKNAFLARPEWELVETVRQNDWVSITVRKK